MNFKENGLNMKKIYDVYSVGDIMLDLIIEANSEELRGLDIKENVQELINLEKRDRILSSINGNSQKLRINGYSLNVFKALSCMGMKTAFATKIGMDEFGLISQKELKNTRIDFDFKTGFGCTDSCLTFIFPSNYKSKHTHEGVSKNITYKDIDVIKLKQSKELLIDANLLDTKNRMRVAQFLTRIANESDCRIIFELNNIDNILKNKDIAKEIIDRSDVVISSFENAYLYLNENNIESIMQNLGKPTSIKILKTKKEFLASQNNKTISISKVTNKSRYSNEYFTAGFIFGFSHNYDLEKSCILGSYLSGKEFVDDNILDDLHRVF